jgi:hypothetical protein
LTGVAGTLMRLHVGSGKNVSLIVPPERIGGAEKEVSTASSIVTSVRRAIAPQTN